MDAIYIPQLLKAPNHQESISLEEFIPGMTTLTPVRGVMVVIHGGNYLEIQLEAETIVTLTCDRCLKNYNHRLSVKTSELIWLEKQPIPEEHLALERELSWNDLSEQLPVNGYFEPLTWLYEQLSLALPFRQVCGQDCQAITITEFESQPTIDNRWSSLEAIKKQLS